jgi:hypothetical protein
MIRLTRDKTAFLCCDIQQIFKKTIFQFEHVAKTASLMIKAAHVLKIPVVVSEQYPEKLGRTYEAIDIKNCHIYSKTDFSMITNEFPREVLSEKQAFVLFGIETHVCVQQTALDLLEKGKSVILVTDGVSSSRPLDRSTAIQRLNHAGAVVMTAEAVMFEIMRTKNCPEFREISGIAKEIAANFAISQTLSTL